MTAEPRLYVWEEPAGHPVLVLAPGGTAKPLAARPTMSDGVVFHCFHKDNVVDLPTDGEARIREVPRGNPQVRDARGRVFLEHLGDDADTYLAPEARPPPWSAWYRQAREREEAEEEQHQTLRRQKRRRSVG